MSVKKQSKLDNIIKPKEWFRSEVETIRGKAIKMVNDISLALEDCDEEIEVLLLKRAAEWANRLYVCEEQMMEMGYLDETQVVHKGLHKEHAVRDASGLSGLISEIRSGR